MQVSMLMRTSSFLIQNSLRAHIFPCSIIMPVPCRIILVPIWLYFSVHHFLGKIFYVGVYCSLGTDHSNSSMHAKSSTLVSTVPLVLTIQIQACVPNLLHWCLLFPWYWPFKFKHAHHLFYADVYCSLGMVLTIQIQACISIPLVLMVWFLHALSWCTTMMLQLKSKLINITIKINWL